MKALTILEKIAVLQKVDQGGQSKTEICKELEIPNSTLSTILKNRLKIRIVYEKGEFELKRKRLRLSKYKNLDAGLLLWLKQAKSQNILISGQLLLEKADNFATEMKVAFKSNLGWLERFRTRHGITLKNISEEAGKVTGHMTSHWMSLTLPAILRDYAAKDIFNADEFGLFYRCLPEKTFVFKGDACHEGKKSKERLTVLVCCNSDGTEKIPLFVIGKSLNPRCFKNDKILPLQFTANKKAWKHMFLLANFVG